MSEGNGVEYRVFGPPGTGKTTWLVRKVSGAAEKFGGDRVLCCSFTKAAATEMVQRITPENAEPVVPAHNIGTLHAICYRALSAPTLAETKVKEWNELHPELALSAKSASRALEDGLDDADEGTDGSADSLLANYSTLRNRLVRLEDMPPAVARFARLWEDWKAESDYFDFTDLLIRGGKELYYPPNGVSVVFVDEAQDMTPLQLSVVRRWAPSLRYYILVGDDDQCIYQFSGASPDTLIDGDIPPEHRIVLSKSWRVPAAVHRLAEGWIKKVSKRQPKEYFPAERKGAVRRIPAATIKDARAAVEDAAQQISMGRTVMFLTACSYMARSSIIPLLKEYAIPFSNRFRVTQGEWNPLRASKADLLEAYLYPQGPEFGGVRFWSAQQLAKWSAVCSFEGLLHRGSRKRIEEMGRAEYVSDDELLDFYATGFVADGLDAAMSFKADWLADHMKADKAKAMRFTMDIYRKGGFDLLDTPPACTVGTIHSVKGGEADVVYLFPDISPQSYEALLASPAGRDAIIRMYYVGMTRAKEELVVCNAATAYNTMAIH